MTDPQAAQLGAVAAGLAILAFYGVAFLLLVLGACHLWLDLRERLAERRQKRNAARQVRCDPAKWQRLMFDEPDRLDAADVISYLRQRDQRLRRTLTDDTNPPHDNP